MKIVTLTPHRGGERIKLYEHCKTMIANQTRQPDDSIFIDYSPRHDKPDLVERIKAGLKEIDNDAVVVVIEDDDYYPSTYLQWVEDNFEGDIFGIPQTYYYQLPMRRYKLWTHPNRSALFTTSFRRSAIKSLPPDDLITLDLWLWEKMPNRVLKDCPNSPLGMKHGIGKCGGIGHGINSPWEWIYDHDLEFLKQTEYFDFYKKFVNSHLSIIGKKIIKRIFK